MSLFACSECNAVEHTALSRYWFRVHNNEPKLCSACDPQIGGWHGAFPKRTVVEVGYVEGPDGFLYRPGDRRLRSDK